MKIKTQKYYFSRSSETVNAWTGNNGYYDLKLTIEIWKLRVCFWWNSR